MKKCPSCETIFEDAVADINCPCVSHGDYSDYFGSGKLIDFDPKELFADHARVSMCPNCMVYVRKLPINNDEEIIPAVENHMEDDIEDDGSTPLNFSYGLPDKCPLCEREMVIVGSPYSVV